MISLKAYAEYGAPLLVLAIGLFLFVYDRIERSFGHYLDGQSKMAQRFHALYAIVHFPRR